jgi:hypothetical protein
MEVPGLLSDTLSGFGMHMIAMKELPFAAVNLNGTSRTTTRAACTPFSSAPKLTSYRFAGQKEGILSSNFHFRSGEMVPQYGVPGQSIFFDIFLADFLKHGSWKSWTSVTLNTQTSCDCSSILPTVASSPSRSFGDDSSHILTGTCFDEAASCNRSIRFSCTVGRSTVSLE